MNIYGFVLVTGFFLLSGFFFGGVIFKPLYQYAKYRRIDGNDLWQACFLLTLLALPTTMGFMSYTIADGNLASFIGTLASGLIIYLSIALSYSPATQVSFADIEFANALRQWAEENISESTRRAAELDEMHKELDLMIKGLENSTK